MFSHRQNADIAVPKSYFNYLIYTVCEHQSLALAITDKKMQIMLPSVNLNCLLNALQ